MNQSADEFWQSTVHLEKGGKEWHLPVRTAPDLRKKFGVKLGGV